MSKKKKEITLGDLVGSVEGLTVRVDKLVGAVEDLATSVKAGFDAVDKRFDQVEGRLKKLEDGQDQIIMKLSNVAYRFEVKELEARINVLEHRVIQLGRKKK